MLAAKLRLALTLLVVCGCLGWASAQAPELRPAEPANPSAPKPHKSAHRSRAKRLQRHVTQPVKRAVHGFVALVAEEKGTGDESATKETFSIQRLGRAVQLPSSRSTLAFGPIQLSEFEVLGMYKASAVDGESGTVTQNAAAGLVRSNFVYQTTLSRSRLALQYTPQLIIYDGRAQLDGTNQNVNFDLGLTLGARSTLYVRNRVGYHGANSLLDEFYSADALTGNVVQNRFLNTTGNFVSNMLEVSLEHRLSARTMLRVSPFYNYEYASATARTSTSEIPFSAESRQTVGVTAEIAHSLSSRTQMGLSYSFQELRLSSQGSGFGPAYHSIGVSYGHQLTPTWRFGVSTGFSRASREPRSYMTMNGTANVTKSFRRSSLAVSYFRGVSSAGYLTANEFSDRTDLSYGFPLGRKLTFGLGGGYFRGNSTDSKIVTGKYAAYNVSYPLFAHLESRLSYTYNWQNGSDPQLLRGSRQFITAGLRWNLSQRLR